MKKYDYYDLNTILVAAGKVLEAINRLPVILRDSQIELPLEFKDSGKGGYLCVYQRNPFIKSGELLLLSKIGTIEDVDDSQFGSKSEKYQKYARKKSIALIYQNEVKTSGQSILNIRGGVAANNSLMISFSGRTEFEDELLVIATMTLCKRLIDENNEIYADGKAISIDDIKGNPLISKEIINAICKYSH